jgi:hypothetical protein
LRFWEVRRGPAILGQVQAGSITWARKQARKQFGDNLTIEPVAVVPGRVPKPQAAAGQKASKVPGKRSALDGAAQVLAETGRPMNCQELIAAMAAKGYWSSPAGKTPAATLYSAIIREITTKGEQARFRKSDRGQFGLRSAPRPA